MTDEDTVRGQARRVGGAAAEASAPDSLERALKVAIDSGRPDPRTSAGRWIATAFAPLEAWPAGARGERLAARATAAVAHARPGVVRLLIRKLGGLLEAVTSDFELVAPTATRGDTEPGLMVRRRLGARDLTVHVDSTRAGRFDLTLDLWGGDRSAEARFSLMRGGRELVSEVSRSGRAHLPNLTGGSYRLAITDGGALLGELDLTFEETAA